MRRVEHKIPNDPAHTFTQSEFHASKKLNPHCATRKFLEREIAHKGTSDVFAYHGCSNHLHPIQDFYKAVHSVKKLKKPVSFEHPHNEPFIFLRNHTLDIPSIRLIDYPSNTHSVSAQENGQLIDDHNKKLRTKLLACSYSLCDDEYGESALYFFENNFSQLLKHKDNNVIDEQFSALDKKHGISKIYDMLKPTSGSLLQIIIPEHLIEKCMYVCRPYGFPYHCNPDDNPFPFKNTELNIIEFIDQVRKGIFCVDRWQGPPQLRIVLTQRYFANPHSGIKIFRHTNASEGSLSKFMKARHQLYEKISEDIEQLII